VDPKMLSIALALGLAVAGPAAAEPAAGALPAGLEMLRRTERAFAKATSEIGVRNGFLMFFAEDAISPPDPGPARARFLSSPAPVEPRPTDLAWEPLVGDIARSTDLGYLTGPASFSGPDGTKHTGVYFSVWRRGDDGLWRVVLDAGLDMPSPAPEFADGRFRAAPPSAWTDSADAPHEGGAAADLERTEREFLAAAAASAAQAYQRFVGEHARLHRDGRHPVLGREAILAEVSKSPATVSGELRKVDVSSAGDLGWTFGTLAVAGGGQARKGAWTRVWKRDDRGRWRIAVDVLNPERAR
jgi:ketosteroid isomerase-like protein